MIKLTSVLGYTVLVAPQHVTFVKPVNGGNSQVYLSDCGFIEVTGSVDDIFELLKPCLYKLPMVLLPVNDKGDTIALSSADVESVESSGEYTYIRTRGGHGFSVELPAQQVKYLLNDCCETA